MASSGLLTPLRTHLARFLARLAPVWRDPFFFVTILDILGKEVLSITLINNADHSVIDWEQFGFYETSMTIFVSFIVVPVGLGFLLGGRKRLFYYLLLDLAVSLLLIFDLWYFRAHSTFLSFMLWQVTGNLEGLASGVWAMARRVDLLFLADFAVLVPLVFGWRRLYRETKRAVAFGILLPLLATGVLFYEHWRLDANGTDSDIRFFEPCWEARQTISYQSPLGFHLFDFFFVYFRNPHVELTAAQQTEIRKWFEANHEERPANKYAGMLKGRNLIVIQVESLEGFMIRHSVDGQEITPVLNSLLPHSLYFRNVYDQAYEGLSSDSDLMTNTSVYPVNRGSTFFRFASNHYNSLPKLLRANGYRTTIAMHPDPGVYWNWKNGLRGIGFETLLDMGSFTNDEILGLGLSDKTFLRQVGELLPKQPQPFYAFMVTLTSHEPFEIPEADQELKIRAGLAESVLGQSFQSFRYVDTQIGRLLGRLREAGILDHSVVVIYGDHTSVHRFFPDELTKIPTVEDWMLDDRPVIPLIVYAPGIEGEEFDVVGGQVDTMPTLLYLLGIDQKQWAHTVMGRPLVNTGRDFAALRESGTVVGRDGETEWARHALRGITLADLIISSDYFKSH